MQIRSLFLFIIFAMGVVFSPVTSAGDNVIIVKFGDFNLDDTYQVIETFPTNVASFNEKNSSFGIEYDYVFDNNISIGGGYHTYSMEYTSSSGPGEVDVSFFMFNAKFHLASGALKPFLGASAGIAITDFTGGIYGNTAGLALAVSAGLRYQFSNVGLYAEYKNYVSADTEDSWFADVDVAGDGIFAGVSVQF